MYGAKLILHGVSMEGSGVATLQLRLPEYWIALCIVSSSFLSLILFQPCEYSELSVIILCPLVCTL